MMQSYLHVANFPSTVGRSFLDLEDPSLKDTTSKISRRLINIESSSTTSSTTRSSFYCPGSPLQVATGVKKRRKIAQGRGKLLDSVKNMSGDWDGGESVQNTPMHFAESTTEPIQEKHKGRDLNIGPLAARFIMDQTTTFFGMLEQMVRNVIGPTEVDWSTAGRKALTMMT